jgi:AcrR family transcriptional regulator/uncharacterized protein (DUF2249 family)
MLLRARSEARRQQIVEAALEILARVPLERLSTRQLARHLGVSQPALFRHFRSREELLVAVVAHARGKLESLIEAVLRDRESPVEQLRALARDLFRHVERHPGLPRLLFSSAPPAEKAVRAALRHVIEMQSSLVAELFREGQRQGLFDRELDAARAARHFIALLQGTILQWQLDDEGAPLEPRADPILSTWLHGVRADASSPAPLPLDEVRSAGRDGLRQLDVRPLLARGTDPLQAILAALDSLGRGGVLKITAPFRPSPLIALLTRRGHAARATEIAPNRWSVEVVVGADPAVDDLRDLEAPEPLERVLESTSRMSPGAVYLARVPRNPRLLIPHLEERGLTWSVYEEHDGSALLRVWKPS